MLDLLLLPLVMLLGHDRQPVRDAAERALSAYVWLADSERVLSRGLASADPEVRRRCGRLSRAHRNFEPYFGLSYPKYQSLSIWKDNAEYRRLENVMLGLPIYPGDPHYRCITRDFAPEIYRVVGFGSSRLVRSYLTIIRATELLQWSGRWQSY